MPDSTDTFRGSNLFVRDIDDRVIPLQGNGSVASERGPFVSNNSGRIGLVANTNTLITSSTTQVFTDLYSLGDGDGARFAFSRTGGFVTSGIFVAQNGRGIEAPVKKNDPLPGGTDTFASFSGPVEIDGNNVFFYAESTAGVMFTGQAGAVSLDSPFGFAVNSSRVVFRGQASDGTYGLYVWNDGAITKLIDNSMSLEGRTISKLSFGHQALSGNLFVFLAEVSPFRLGVYRAVFGVDNFAAASLGAGQALSGVEFGLHPGSGPVGGTVFTDVNADGAFDNGDVPVMSAEVFVDANGNRLLDAGETFTTTNTNGQYLLNNLSGLSTVSVVIVPPNGLVATAPVSSPGVRNVTVLPGQVVDRTDFTLATPGASGSSADGSATGAVFNDLNENGLRDAGEPGLSGVTVFVDENGDRVLNGGERSAVTGVSGDYTVGQLRGNRHAVRVVVPAGVRQICPLGNAFVKRTVQTTDSPVEVVVGDLDRDGDDDMIASSDLADEVQVFLSQGNGGFGVATRVSVPTGPGALAVCKFRGSDQAPGIVVGHRVSNNVTVLTRQANGSFTSQSLVTPAQTAVGNRSRL